MSAGCTRESSMQLSTTLPAFQAVDGFVGNSQHASNLQLRACPVCQHSEQRSVVAMNDFQFFTDSATAPKRARLQQMQCQHCLALFLNPCYSDAGFANLFAEAGMSYGSSALRPTEQRDWLAARGLLQPGSVALDVGCYDGGFLSQLPAELLRQGVDIDAGAISRGRQRDPALELVHSAFDRFSVSRCPQLITMFHVLEHLTDPVGVLRRLREVASDDARLVVEVPVLEWGSTNDINGFLSVTHVTHFSCHSLRNALQVAGWQLIEAAKMDGYNGYRVVAVKAAPQAALPGDAGELLALQAILDSWELARQHADRALAVLTGQARTVVWGAGLHTEFLYQRSRLFKDSEQRFLLVDSDALKQGHSWRGLPILAPSALVELDWTDTHLVVSSYGGQAAITAAALALGVPADRVLCLYDEVCVC